MQQANWKRSASWFCKSDNAACPLLCTFQLIAWCVLTLPLQVCTYIREARSVNELNNKNILAMYANVLNRGGLQVAGRLHKGARTARACS